MSKNFIYGYNIIMYNNKIKFLLIKGGIKNEMAM